VRPSSAINHVISTAIDVVVTLSVQYMHTPDFIISVSFHNDPVNASACLLDLLLSVVAFLLHKIGIIIDERKFEIPIYLTHPS